MRGPSRSRVELNSFPARGSVTRTAKQFKLEAG
jgi:hypothetical protein